jgi:hypothetical protein
MRGSTRACCNLPYGISTEMQPFIYVCGELVQRLPNKPVEGASLSFDLSRLEVCDCGVLIRMMAGPEVGQ